jgi:hypothetical protein
LLTIGEDSVNVGHKKYHHLRELTSCDDFGNRPWDMNPCNSKSKIWIHNATTEKDEESCNICTDNNERRSLIKMNLPVDLCGSKKKVHIIITAP